MFFFNLGPTYVHVHVLLLAALKVASNLLTMASERITWLVKILIS